MLLIHYCYVNIIEVSWGVDNVKWLKYLLFNTYVCFILIFIVGCNILCLYYLNIKYILLISVFYTVLLHMIIHLYEGYKLGTYKVSEIVYSVSLATLLCNCLTYGLIFIINLDFKIFIYMFLLQIIQTLFTILWGVVGNKLYFLIFEHHQILLIFGHDPTEVSKKIISRKNRYFITRMISDLLTSKEIIELSTVYDSIMLYEVRKDLRDLITVYCFEEEKSLFIIPEIPEIIRRGTHNLYLMDMPLLVANHWGLSLGQKIVKRVMDLLIIIPVAIIVSPFMLITALCIKLYDRGPIIYKQDRLTIDGEVFQVYKFRSMIVNAEQKGAQLSTENDNRITPIGKIIRAIRFDELPQIINILKGDMSIVGPRPERPEIADEYYNEFPEFKLRLKVKAGLTGYAQVFGKYNTTPKDKLKLDLMYINDYSLYMDLKLIIYTIKILFMKSSTEGIEEGKKTAI